MSETTFMGVPREKIDWSPRINFDICNDCMECVKFCPHEVFEEIAGDGHKFTVKNPNNCVVFCRACGKACGLDAITFPEKKETAAEIKRIRKEAKNG